MCLWQHDQHGLHRVEWDYTYTTDYIYDDGDKATAPAFAPYLRPVGKAIAPALAPYLHPVGNILSININGAETINDRNYLYDRLDRLTSDGVGEDDQYQNL